jgi:hypothetical protein
MTSMVARHLVYIGIAFLFLACIACGITAALFLAGR